MVKTFGVTELFSASPPGSGHVRFSIRQTVHSERLRIARALFSRPVAMPGPKWVSVSLPKQMAAPGATGGGHPYPCTRPH